MFARRIHALFGLVKTEPRVDETDVQSPPQPQPETQAMEWDGQATGVDWQDPVIREPREPAPLLPPESLNEEEKEPPLFASSEEDEDVVLDDDATADAVKKKKKKKHKQRRTKPAPQSLDAHPSYQHAQSALDQFNQCAQEAANTAIEDLPDVIQPAASLANELKELPLERFTESVYKTIVQIRGTMRTIQRRAHKLDPAAASSSAGAGASGASSAGPLPSWDEIHPSQWAASLERWNYHHMDQLFVQAGPRRSSHDAHLTLYSPPCMKGDDCRGKQEFGFVLMASMGVADLKAHESSGFVPTGKAPCILCGLFLISSLENYADAGDLAMPKGVMAQWFYNPVNEPDGYEEDACHKPLTPTSGLVAPVLRYNHASLVKYQDAHGVWRLNHSAFRSKNEPTGTGAPIPGRR